MKLYECSLLLTLGILAGLAMASIATTKMLNLEEDNIAEEIIEELIEIQTGIETDLTPDSPED